jgi:ubiquinone/menaquinone biosynthesis C-methylase UbiE
MKTVRLGAKTPPDIQHQMWEITLNGKLNLAPLQNPIHVLDVATGNGNWAIDFGETASYRVNLRR